MNFTKHINFISDFDGTITKQDTIQTFLQHFTQDKWLNIETLWRNNKISSKECLTKQVDLLPILTQQKIDDFLLQEIQIDKSFLSFGDFVKKNNHSLVIVSDGFDYFINKILEQNMLSDIDIYSNHIQCENGKISINFPHYSKNCKCEMGTCKCSILKKLKEQRKDWTSVYIGDGLSDACISHNIDVVFAKDFLYEYCKKNRQKEFCKFSTFEDIINYFKKI